MLGKEDKWSLEFVVTFGDVTFVLLTVVIP